MSSLLLYVALPAVWLTEIATVVIILLVLIFAKRDWLNEGQRMHNKKVKTKE